MGQNTNNVLIPARFIITIGHFIAVVIASYSIVHNIQKSLSNGAENVALQSEYFDEAMRSSRSAIYMAYFCFTIDLFGLLSGFSMFFERVNFLSCLLHFIGSVWFSWFVEYKWRYERLWGMVGLTNVTTALVELGVIFCAIFVQKRTY